MAVPRGGRVPGPTATSGADLSEVAGRGVAVGAAPKKTSRTVMTVSWPVMAECVKAAVSTGSAADVCSGHDKVCRERVSLGAIKPVQGNSGFYFVVSLPGLGR
jgi:hypothetical protein